MRIKKHSHNKYKVRCVPEAARVICSTFDFYAISEFYRGAIAKIEFY